jgi:MoaA/NifB/PqqE/SkfB family radical SAM enzyme
MLARLTYRMLSEVSPRLLWKAGWLWARGGMRALAAHRKRVRRGELFPPFLFLALTNACNLRCTGCWIETKQRFQALSLDDVEGVITAGKRQQAYVYTLLGGEPLMYPPLWDILERHPECYFQIITNGLFFDEANVARIRQLGNVTPLVSIDGFQAQNDARRGQGVFDEAVQGLERMQRAKLLYGVATVVTGANLDEVLTDRYVQYFVQRGAMYLWYYVYRPVGPNPSPQLCVSREQMIHIRRKLLELRRRHPIILIDTYWDADGKALCPAALGMGFHIGPQGSIEPCPPLSFACQTVRDHDRDLFRTINSSAFLRGFQEFAASHTRGCVILEQPQELVRYLRQQEATDYSTRDAYAELSASTPRGSHHLPGEEIPEDYWVYRMLKRQVFFGMGAYG